MPVAEDFGTRRLTGPADLVAALTDGDCTDAITSPAGDALELLPNGAPAAPGSPPPPEVWDTGLFRLAMAADVHSRDRAYGELAAVVHHFMTQRLEVVGIEALRSAVGVLLRVRRWAATNPYSVRTPHYLERIAHAFDAWHHIREVSRAVDVRHDLVGRSRGRTDELILRSLFTEEGRSIVASHARGVVEACGRLGLETDALRRCQWIANLLTYRTRDGNWQASPTECLRLCTDLSREIGHEETISALRALVLTAWNGLSLETNLLRDVFRGSGLEDCVALAAEIDERFEALFTAGSAEVVYFPSERSLGRRRRSRVEPEPNRRFVF